MGSNAAVSYAKCFSLQMRASMGKPVCCRFRQATSVSSLRSKPKHPSIDDQVTSFTGSERIPRMKFE
jgi:hypothetical protein